MNKALTMLNALTIDLEDWYHPELVRRRLSFREQEAQIEQSTHLLLDLLHKQGVKGTFFIVGQIAQQYPRLIEAIAADGHELGCHGMTHRPLWEMTPDDFRRELEQFEKVISAIIPGIEITGFRAPTFSMDNRTHWALGILAEFGYKYDSSIFPMKTPLYGVNGCPLQPYRPSAEDVRQSDSRSKLVEFPVSVCSWMGLRVPVSGGLYLRTLPFSLIKLCLGRISGRRPVVLYIHPWEAYPDTPRLRLPVWARLAMYYNTTAMLPRLRALLQTFSFAPMRTVLEKLGVLIG